MHSQLHFLQMCNYPITGASINSFFYFHEICGIKCPKSFHRDTLGEVSRLVHVAAAQNRYVVREKLQRYHGQER